MNTIHKKEYITPSIEIVILDNEISLALESNPAFGPNEESLLILPDNNNNCFKA